MSQNPDFTILDITDRVKKNLMERGVADQHYPQDDYHIQKQIETVKDSLAARGVDPVNPHGAKPASSSGPPKKRKKAKGGRRKTIRRKGGRRTKRKRGKHTRRK